MLGGMVVADTANIMRAVNLAMPVSSTIAACHPGVINSIAVIKGLLRRSAIIGGRRCTRRFSGCNRWFGVFLFDEGDRGWCIWSR
jgi:hypothetical protein